MTYSLNRAFGVMHEARLALAFGGLLTGVIAGGCAAGGDGGGGIGGDGGRDAAIESGAPDAAAPDAGGDASADAAPVDAGPDSSLTPGSAGTCEACTIDEDCMTGSHCLVLAGGGMACLPGCPGEIPDCPPRFDCVTDFSVGLPGPICAPLGERCCVDADGDLHGTGVGCLGIDCNDDDTTVNSSAMELCDGLDNECNGTVDDGDPDLMCPRGAHVAAEGCVSGACEIASCEPGWDDCNGLREDGCETPLDTTVDCGGCGTSCALPNALTTCASGSCGIASCEPGFGDCDGDPSNGCETALNTVDNCGVCGGVCLRPNAIPDCSTGTCRIGSCNPNWDNCNGNDTDGCETTTANNLNCGGCGILCNPANGFGDCGLGSCAISSCLAGWGDCDGGAMNGCETDTRTSASHCGSCGSPCNLPNASASCSIGSCVVSACSGDFSNCDGVQTNGCEVNHASVAGSCGGGGNAGSYSGDRSCGFICSSNTSWDAFSTFNGTAGGWYRATVTEGSDCPATIEHRIRLSSPAGTNYDMVVHRGCGTVVGTGDSVTVSQSDSTGSDDDFTYYVQVIHVSGASCGQWTLTFEGHGC
ncbi:MAG: putative metal-binding motif-containing protein [Myxococcales bacterium]|nr:putative metal-binding motif-containing protein [Myxococcales bacterium]